MNEADIRNHVKCLRRFYTDFVVYLAVNSAFLFLWLISGAGYFWPIWVIIGWGIGLGVHALSLGLLPQITSILPFMTPEWEDEEVRRVMGTSDNQTEDEDAMSETATPEEKKPPAIKPSMKT